MERREIGEGTGILRRRNWLCAAAHFLLAVQNFTGILRRLRRLRAASVIVLAVGKMIGRYSGGDAAFVSLRIFFWLRQKQRCGASRPSDDGKMLVIEPDGVVSTCGGAKNPRHRMMSGIFGDPYGNRTHITAVKGRCLNLLTNGPGSGNLTRTDDNTGMNRVLYQLSYAARFNSLLAEQQDEL